MSIDPRRLGHAITRDVAGAELTVPWGPLAAIAGTCLVLGLLAAQADLLEHGADHWRAFRSSSRRPRVRA